VPARGIAFTPDGNKLAAFGSPEIKILDVATGHTLQTLHSNASSVGGIVFNPDGNMLASIGTYNPYSETLILEVWNTNHGTLLFSHQEDGRIGAITISPDGNSIAVSSDYGVKLFNAHTGESVRSFDVYIYPTNVAFTPDGQGVIIATNDQEISIMDIESGHLIKTLELVGNDQFVVSPDGNTLAVTGVWDSGKNMYVTKLWDMESGRLLKAIETNSYWYWEISFSPDGRKIVSTDYDSVVRILDTESGDLLNTIEYSDIAFEAAFKPTSSEDMGSAYLLAAGYDNGDVLYWDVKNSQVIQSFEGFKQKVVTIDFYPIGKTLTAGIYQGLIHSWDIASGQLLNTIEIEDHHVAKIIYSPDGRLLAVSSWDGIKVFDAVTWQSLYEVNKSNLANIVVFAPDGQLIAVMEDETSLDIWDVDEDQLLYHLPNKDKYGDIFFSGVSISSDGQFLAGGGVNGVIFIWDLPTQQLLHEIQGHEIAFSNGGQSSINHVAFNPHNNILASAGYFGTVKLWDAKTGQLLFTLNDINESVNSVSFSPDGRMLAAGVSDGTIRVWGIEAP
jgi:WD40 repeat protein